MSSFQLLQRKGLQTIALLLLAESVSFTNAARLWTNYQNWSPLYGHKGEKSAAAESVSSKAASGANSVSVVQQCQARESSSALCLNTAAAVVSTTPSLPPARLYPRTRLPKHTVTAAFGKCNVDVDCCTKHCPSCVTNIRGGGLHSDSGGSGAAASTVEAALTLTKSAAQSAVSGAAAKTQVTPFDLPLNLWKIIFQTILTAINIACWLIPLRSKRITENKLGMSLANAFSGGVFLSLAFGHLIPECVHGFSSIYGHQNYNEALPYMVVLSGYLLIFFVEKVAFDAHGLMSHQHDEVGERQHSDRGTSGNIVANGSKSNLVKGKSELSVGRSSIILLGALAVHSILEMTALGLTDTFGDSALLSLSIALHQPAESIALLVAFLKSGMPHNRIIRYLTAFSAMGPIGVALGMAVNEFAALIVDAIMLAMVAGTFVYVGATEVIPEEWEEQEHKWRKFFALIAGIVSIYSITQYTMTLEGAKT